MTIRSHSPENKKRYLKPVVSIGAGGVPAGKDTGPVEMTIAPGNTVFGPS